MAFVCLRSSLSRAALPGLGNGGPTQTLALLAGSPAIDAGDPACPPPASDQRGVSRPQGPRRDIGAFEVSVPLPAAPTTGRPAQPQAIWAALLVLGLLVPVGAAAGLSRPGSERRNV